MNTEGPVAILCLPPCSCPENPDRGLGHPPRERDPEDVLRGSPGPLHQHPQTRQRKLLPGHRQQRRVRSRTGQHSAARPNA